MSEHLRIRISSIRKFNYFFQEAYEGGKGGGKRGGLAMGIYLSLACVLVVCGI